MIQKRSNPFEQSEIETNEQEEAKIQKRINPLTLEAVEMQQQQPEVVQAQTLPEEPAHTPVLTQEKHPTAVEGKAKRKLVFTKVNKALLTELYAATGKIAAELIDSALLCLAYCDYPKAYLRAKAALEAKGCEIV